METNIVKIGNSRGVVIPSAILKALDMTDHSTVNLYIENNVLKISKTPSRSGWEAAAKQMHDLGDDNLLMPDVFKDESFKDWEW